MTKLNDDRIRRREILFAGIVLLNSSWIYYVYLSITQMGTFGPALLSRALEGSAERPYVYRALVPWLAKMASVFIPASLPDALVSAPPPIARTYHALQSGGYGREAVVVLMIVLIALLGVAYAQRFFMQSLGSYAPLEQIFLPLGTQILILPFTAYFGYYYDFPQIVLLTLALGYMYRMEWGRYLILLALASLNKETSVFLVAIFVLYYLPRLTRVEFLKLLTIQALVYGVIRVWLIFAYRENPGTMIVITWQNHVNQYLAYPPALFMTLGFLVLFAFIILRHWRQKHPFLRASSITLIIILILFFVAGMPIEFRVFLDVISVIALLVYSPARQAPDLGGA